VTSLARRRAAPERFRPSHLPPPSGPQLHLKKHLTHLEKIWYGTSIAYDKVGCLRRAAQGQAQLHTAAQACAGLPWGAHCALPLQHAAAAAWA
jgi:hypothetical protein